MELITVRWILTDRFTKGAVERNRRRGESHRLQEFEYRDSLPTKEELKDLTYRSKIEIEGQVRIVNIPGVDICACCAPHVDRTGEIGNIKLVDMVSYKGGERITMLSGSRALADHQQKEESVKKISCTALCKGYRSCRSCRKIKRRAA